MGRRIARVGLLTGLSLIMFLVEGLFPPMVVPGARLGLGNIFIMMILLCFSYGEALLAVAVKSLLSAIFIGNLSASLYSLPAGVAAISVSYLLVRALSKRISLFSVGVVSATVHNLVQLLVFSLVTKTAKVLLYAPYLTFLGLIAGCVTGLATHYLLVYGRKFILKENKKA